MELKVVPSNKMQETEGEGIWGVRWRTNSQLGRHEILYKRDFQNGNVKLAAWYTFADDSQKKDLDSRYRFIIAIKLFSI